MSKRTKRKQWSVNQAIDREETNSIIDSQFSLLEQYIKPWENVYPRSKVWKVASIESALGTARKIGTQEHATHVLITGSLHVVGEALRILLKTE